MDNRTLELVAKEKNKDITGLETEELKIRRSLIDNIDKQSAEAAKAQRKNLEAAAVDGDQQAAVDGDQQAAVRIDDPVMDEREAQVVKKAQRVHDHNPFDTRKTPEEVQDQKAKDQAREQARRDEEARKNLEHKK